MFVIPCYCLYHYRDKLQWLNRLYISMNWTGLVVWWCFWYQFLLCRTRTNCLFVTARAQGLAYCEIVTVDSQPLSHNYVKNIVETRKEHLLISLGVGFCRWTSIYPFIHPCGPWPPIQTPPRDHCRWKTLNCFSQIRRVLPPWTHSLKSPRLPGNYSLCFKLN